MSDFFSGQSGGGLTGGMSSAAKMAAGALLVHQLMRYARGNATPGAESTAGAGGGLGGMLGGLLGGGASPMEGAMSSGGAGGLGGLGALLGGGGLGALLSGAGGGGGLGGLLGGLGGMLGNLRGQGLGQQVDSWVSPGPNQHVSPQDLERGFDPAEIDEAARHAGTDRNSVLQEMSSLLPQLVDRATPRGNMPQREEELGHSGGFGGLLGGLLGGGQQSGTATQSGPLPRG